MTVTQTTALYEEAYRKFNRLLSNYKCLSLEFIETKKLIFISLEKFKKAYPVFIDRDNYEKFLSQTENFLLDR